MKKLFIIPLLLLTHCVTTLKLNESVTLKGYDFRGFLDEGFIFTPLEYDYVDIIGIVTVEITPEVSPHSHNPYDISLSQEYDLTKSHKIKKIDTQKALVMAKEKAVEFGANGIMLLKITHSDNFDPLNPELSSAINKNTFYISGFAFRNR